VRLGWVCGLPFDDHSQRSDDHEAGTSVTKYLILLRGINVGGKNKVPMAALRELLEELGYSNVATYIASGNVILSSRRAPGGIKRQIESALPKRFRLDSELIAVRVMTHAELRAVVDHKPQGFGWILQALDRLRQRAVSPLLTGSTSRPFLPDKTQSA
jgi:hypothetical protein